MYCEQIPDERDILKHLLANQMAFHLFSVLVNVNIPSVCLLSKIWFRTFHTDLERETCSLGKKMCL